MDGGVGYGLGGDDDDDDDNDDEACLRGRLVGFLRLR